MYESFGPENPTQLNHHHCPAITWRSEHPCTRHIAGNIRAPQEKEPTRLEEKQEKDTLLDSYLNKAILVEMNGQKNWFLRHN